MHACSTSLVEKSVYKVIACLTYFQDSDITMLISHWRHPLTNNSEKLSF